MHRISRMGVGVRVAVIGTGIAGNAAAWTSSKRYPVTVHDRELRPGPLLAATFHGRRRALTSPALLRSFFALPLVTLKIVVAIH
jgi:NADPH-dependent glutamate synthase beta subunit-like oxidoreductase